MVYLSSERFRFNLSSTGFNQGSTRFNQGSARFAFIFFMAFLAFLAGSALAQQDISGQFQEISPSEAAAVAGLPDGSFQEYSGFFEISPEAPAEEGVAEVQQFDIRGQEPQQVYYGGPGEQLVVPYTEFQTAATSVEPNSLWIEGPDAWARYARVPRGSSLSLIALTASPGTGTLYEIYPSGRIDRSELYISTYNRIAFYADTAGQHILLFVKDSIPSNAVLVDVTSAPPVPTPPTRPGRATIMIFSDWLTGYDVYVDGVYQFTEGDGGIPDGYSSVTVSGDATHRITIRKGGYYYSGSRYFRSGYTYNLRINPS